MKKYSIRIVNYSSLDVEANSKEEAIQKANETLSHSDSTMDEAISLNGSGWEVDDEAEE